MVATTPDGSRVVLSHTAPCRGNSAYGLTFIDLETNRVVSSQPQLAEPLPASEGPTSFYAAVLHVVAGDDIWWEQGDFGSFTMCSQRWRISVCSIGDRLVSRLDKDTPRCGQAV